MRVAAIYDIHGNLPALQAVLAEIRAANADRIVVGGDVVPGPLTKEALLCLLDFELPVQFIHGNCEIDLLEQMAGRDPLEVPEKHRHVFRWTAQALAEYQPLFAAWPKTVQMEIPGLGRVLFCHGTPRHENEIFTRQTAEERLLPVFDTVDASLVICGHTHMQFDRMIGHTRVVNAGSVGMRFGGPGADWLLLGPEIQLKHTSYDLTKAADRIRASGYPEDFVSRYLLDPPTEEAMLVFFGRRELKYAP